MPVTYRRERQINDDQMLALDGMILQRGQAAHRTQMEAPVSDAEALGQAVGTKLLEMAGGRGLAWTPGGDAALRG